VTGFAPHLSILSSPQRKLWPELAAIPSHFVLYGGTAIALRLGHRPSVDFDFLSHRAFAVDELTSQIAFLEKAERLRVAPDTLTVSVPAGGPVAVSFFGGIRFGRVGTPDRLPENGIAVASLLDLAATKAAVVQQRAEAKDYLDLHALIRAGLSLETALGAAQVLYGSQFNPAITLKALAYFGDGDLPSIPPEVRALLQEKSSRVGHIPTLALASTVLGLEDSAGP